MPNVRTSSRPKEVDGAVIYSEVTRTSSSNLRKGVSSLIIKADDNGWVILFEKLKITNCNVSLKIAFSYSEPGLYKTQQLSEYDMSFTCNSKMPLSAQIFPDNSKYMAVDLFINEHTTDPNDYLFRFVATSFKPLRHGRCSNSRRKCSIISTSIRSLCIDRDLTCDGIKNCENGEDEIKYCGQRRSKSLLGNLISGIVTLFVICVLLSAMVAVLKRFGCIRNNQRTGRTFGWQFGRRSDAGAPSSGVTMMQPAAVVYAPQSGVIIDSTHPGPQPQMFTGAGYGFSPSLTSPMPQAPVYPQNNIHQQTGTNGYPIQSAPGYTHPIGPPPSYSAR